MWMNLENDHLPGRKKKPVYFHGSTAVQAYSPKDLERTARKNSKVSSFKCE